MALLTLRNAERVRNSGTRRGEIRGKRKISLKSTCSNASRKETISWWEETLDWATWVQWGGWRTHVWCCVLLNANVVLGFPSGSRRMRSRVTWASVHAKRRIWARGTLDSCLSWLGCFAAYTFLSVAVFTHLGPCGCHIFGLCSHPKSNSTYPLLSGEFYIIAHQPWSLEMLQDSLCRRNTCQTTTQRPILSIALVPPFYILISLAYILPSSL